MLLKSWTNTEMAETWEEEGETLEFADLLGVFSGEIRTFFAFFVILPIAHFFTSICVCGTA